MYQIRLYLLFRYCTLLGSHNDLISQWAVFMLGGGHFAGAVFRGAEPILHKTFHCYTVRAKQGGSQGASDNSRGHAKSAGASLRRYNEQALVQHVQVSSKVDPSHMVNWGWRKAMQL